MQGLTYLYRSYHEEDTVRLAGILAEWSHPGMVIALDGELGAGKTRFSQAFAKAMGVSSVVNSPTFTLIKEYEGMKYPLYHMDVYRVNMTEAEELGLDEYFYGDGVTLVEWASHISELLPTDHLAIRISGSADQTRIFEIWPVGDFYNLKCKTLKQNEVIE